MTNASLARGRATRQLVRSLDRVGSRALEENIATARSNGIDVLTLQGAPSRPMPSHVEAALAEALASPAPQPSRGLPRLRHAIQKALATEGAELDPGEEILVTNGAMQALNLLFRALLNPGDNVVIPAPNFFFGGSVELAGGAARYVRGARASDGWRWDLDALEKAIDGNTKAIVFSNPTNPTGYMPSIEDLGQMAEIARRRGLPILSDESYDRFVFDDGTFTSAVAVREWMNTFILVRSLSKGYALAPWRVGYIAADREIIEGCLKILEWETLYTSHGSQVVAAAAIEGPQDWLGGVVAEYQKHRDLVWSALNASDGLSSALPAAGPFMFVEVGSIGARGMDPCEVLLSRAGIPTVGGACFGDDEHVRLPYGGTPETIEKLCERLEGFTV